MKISNDPNDPIAQSLVEDATNLANIAATEARSRARARTGLACVALAVLICLPTFTICFLKLAPHSKAPHRLTEVAAASNAARSISPAYVKAYPVSVTNHLNPVPAGVTGREKELLTELPGVPLLIVRNQAGEVTRVLVFER